MNGWKLVEEICNLEVGRIFLTVRTIKQCNSLPHQVVGAPSREFFKNRLDNHLTRMLWYRVSCLEQEVGQKTSKISFSPKIPYCMFYVTAPLWLWNVSMMEKDISTHIYQALGSEHLWECCCVPATKVHVAHRKQICSHGRPNVNCSPQRYLHMGWLVFLNTTVQKSECGGGTNIVNE